MGKGQSPLAVQIWGEALRSLDSEAAEEAFWLLAPLPALSFCSWGCRCEELVAAEFMGLQNLAHLGVSMMALNAGSESEEEVFRRIRRELGGNRCVVWFGRASAGIVREAIDLKRFSALKWSPSGKRSEVIENEIPIRTARFYCLHPSRLHMQSSGSSRWLALLNSSAITMRPAVIGLCPRRAEPTMRGCGRGAIDAFFNSLNTCSSPAQIRQTITRWKSGFIGAEYVLEGAAGVSKRRSANQLRRAAESCVRAIRILNGIDSNLKNLKGTKVQPFDRFRGEFALVAACADDASSLIVEAALSALGVEEALRAALFAEGNASGQALEELLYLARSGSPRFRQLAARRLAGVADNRATSVLRQLLYERDSAISDTALHALAQLPATDFLPMLRNIYPHVPPTRQGSAVSLRASILALLTQGSSDLESSDILVEALVTEGEKESETLRAIAAWLLHDRYGTDSVAIFRQVLESGPSGARRLARTYLARLGELV